MDMILRILFIPAKGFLLWALLELATYCLTPGSRGRSSLGRVFALSLYLNFSLTCHPTCGDEIVDELYLMSSHNSPLEPAAGGARR